MNLRSRILRAALAGTTTALCLASTLLIAACAEKEPYDFPVMRLTSPPAVEMQTDR
jgi:hypothetical protein